MKRLAVIPLALALLGVVLFFDHVPRPAAEKEAEGGPFPSNWFMLQRLWPDQTIAVADYLAAHREAVALHQSRLDEQPPWVPVGPNNIGGRITDLVGHPTNAQVFYVAAASGGIFKTLDGGSTFTPIFDSAPGLSMGALAIDLAHPDTVYAGTGEANSAGYSYFGTGVYRTTNGGTSWTPLGLEETRYIARIVIDQDNPQSIWVAAMGELFVTNEERGVYHSIDGGTTWNRVLFVNDSTGASDVVINPANPQIVYAGMWQRIRTIENRDVGGRGSGIFKSIDGGANWLRLTDGLPPQGENIGRIGLAISESNPNILFAIYSDHPGNFLGIFRSADGGETWSQTNDGSLGNIFSSYGWYFGNIRVRPDNADMVFALGVSLARSTNGGQSWNYIANGVHVDHHAMWFVPSQPTTILLGHDGGLNRSTNNGNSWTFLPGLPINQFYAADVDYQQPQRRYGGTQDDGTMRTLTGGANDWAEIYGGDGFYCLVDPTNSNRIWAEYQNGGLARSDDGGDNFDWLMSDIPGNDRINWSMPVALDPSNSSRVYLGTNHVYRSTNYGDSWTSISGDLTDGPGGGNLVFGTIATMAVSPVNGQVIFVGTDDANVWSTQNGGSSWQNRTAGLPDRWITMVAPDPHLANVVYVTISGFRNNEQDAHIFYSDNYGATWQDISSDLPVGPLNDVIPDPEIAGRLYVASDFGTFVTSDLGAHWLALGEDLPAVPVIDLILHNPTRILTAATYGRSMFTLDLNQLGLNRPPVIDSFTPANLDTIVAPQTLTFSVQATDPDGDPMTYVWTRNADTVATSPSVELQFADSGVTEHIVVTVADSSLSTSHQWTFYVTSGAAAHGPFTPYPSSLMLSAFPNPFNSTATIGYSLPRAGQTELNLYDITGRRVRQLLNGILPVGRGSISWTAGNLPSGTYFLHLSAAGQTKIQKVLLIR
jgi:photosystem II stability/assembly factor-like uncharacterized protein